MRCRPITRALLASALFCSGPPTASAQVPDTFDAGEWLGMIDRAAVGGPSCAVSAAYGNGLRLAFSIGADFAWRLTLDDPGRAFETGDAVQVRVRVDRRAYRSFQGQGTPDHALGIGIDYGDPLIEQVRRGRVLEIGYSGERFGFDLSGTFVALGAARACAQRLALDLTAPPAAAPATDPTPGDRRRAEARAFVNMLMGRLADPTADLLRPEDTPSQFLGHDSVFRTSGTIASVRIVPVTQGADRETIVSSLIAADRRFCEEGFDETVLSDRLAEDAYLQTNCREPEWAAYYIVVARPDGGHYVISLSAIEPASPGPSRMAARIRVEAPDVARRMAGFALSDDALRGAR